MSAIQRPSLLSSAPSSCPENCTTTPKTQIKVSWIYTFQIFEHLNCYSTEFDISVCSFFYFDFICLEINGATAGNIGPQFTYVLGYAWYLVRMIRT